jgi:hypothetical protein
MANAAFCLAVDEAQATTIVSRLGAAGFDDEAISILMKDDRTTRRFGSDYDIAPDEVPEAAGARVGGAMDVMGGLAPLTLDGVGPLVATGPLLIGLGGTTAGPAGGGVAGGLVGLGMPEFEARIYDGKLKTGSILLSVNAPNGDRLRRVTALFQQAGASHITTTTERKGPKAELAAPSAP